MEVRNKALGGCDELNDLVGQQVGFDGGDPKAIDALDVIQGAYQVDKRLGSFPF